MRPMLDPAPDQNALRERLVQAYSAGQLNGAMRRLVECQAEIAPEAGDELAAAEALDVAFFEAETPTSMAAGALEKVFSNIGADPTEAHTQQAAAHQAAARRAGAMIDEILRLPHCLHDDTLEAIGRGGWTFAGPGLRTLKLEMDDGAEAEIIRIEPGWGAPRHTHHGGEYTLVLTGAFVDERGRYEPGDIAFAGPGITHRPHAAQGAVCYALAVCEAPLEFTGALGLIQKLWRH
jgi:putative transcriptional regulator